MLPDLKGFFITLIVLGAAAGMAAAWLVPWLWGLVKPLIHTLTA